MTMLQLTQCYWSPIVRLIFLPWDMIRLVEVCSFMMLKTPMMSPNPEDLFSFHKQFWNVKLLLIKWQLIAISLSPPAAVISLLMMTHRGGPVQSHHWRSLEHAEFWRQRGDRWRLQPRHRRVAGPGCPCGQPLECQRKLLLLPPYSW